MKTTLLSLFLFCKLLMCFAQDTALNKYGLYVIKDKRSFMESVKTNPDKTMEDVHKATKGIMLDLRYSTGSNFMHTKLYPPITTTYLRKPAVTALQKIERKLKKHGLGLKVFDAYRPYSVTEKMWQLVKDDRYAADPKNGSGHNRGIAVDLTIINLNTGKELNMGTGFDNFSDTAHHDFKGLSKEVLKNRILLRSVMESYGFKALESEWWHYSLPVAKDYELLDLSFEELSHLQLN